MIGPPLLRAAGAAVADVAVVNRSPRSLAEPGNIRYIANGDLAAVLTDSVTGHRAAGRSSSPITPPNIEHSGSPTSQHEAPRKEPCRFEARTAPRRRLPLPAGDPGALGRRRHPSWPWPSTTST
jgi:hypothetical protein